MRGRIVVLLGLLGLGLSLVASPAGASDEFSDVPENHPFHDEISWLAEIGLTHGFADGTFRPEESISRQAVAAWLYRLAGSPAGPFDPPGFTDVPTDDPFYDEIAWMVEEGIAVGYPDGTFRPMQSIKRHALAEWLWRFAGAPGGDYPDSELSDVALFGPAIEWLAGHDITNGYDDGTFRGSQPITRAAVAAWFNRYPQPAVLLVTSTTDDWAPGSLRWAIDHSSAAGRIGIGLPGVDVVPSIDVGDGTYLLTQCGAVGDDANGGGDLDHTGAGALYLRNLGDGATIQQTCPGERVLDQLGGVLLTLARVTITGGDQAFGNGGGVRARSDVALVAASIIGNHSAGVAPTGCIASTGNPVLRRPALGGGVRATGAITAIKSTIADNTVTGSYAQTPCSPQPSHLWSDAVGGGIAADGTVALDASTIRNNAALVDNSASPYSARVVTGTAKGGGVWAGEAVNVDDSTIADNDATGHISTASGGGIRTESTIDVESSTFAGNSSSGSGQHCGETPSEGGAIGAASHASLTSSTISENQVAPDYQSHDHTWNECAFLLGGYLTFDEISRGSAVVVGNGAYPQAALTVTASTVVANTGGGGALAGALVLAATVITDNGDKNCHTTGTSDGYSFVDDTSCGPLGPTDTVIAEADPKLGSLVDNGGSTLTRVPFPGGPLIDAIPLAACPASLDQRGTTRPQGAGCDIGAVEATAPDLDTSPIVLSVTDHTDGLQPHSLRWAIGQANASGGSHHVVIEMDEGSYALDQCAWSEGGDFGDLLHDSPKNLTIVGLGVGATIEQTCSGRILEHRSTGLLTLDHLTITGGDVHWSSAADPGRGGGVRADGSVVLRSTTLIDNRASDAGGGLWSAGDVSVETSTLEHNSVLGTHGEWMECGPFGPPWCLYHANWSSPRGGGLWSAGAVLLDDSTVRGNWVQMAPTEPILYDAFIGSAEGGGVRANGSVTVVASLVDTNDAVSQFGTASGGGISSGSSVEVDSSTFTGNRAGSQRLPPDGTACQPAPGSGAAISATSHVAITSSTFSGNEVTLTPDPLPFECADLWALAGAVSSRASVVSAGDPADDEDRPAITVTTSTIIDNPGSGAGLLGSVTLSASVVANNGEANCGHPAETGGYSFVDDESCGVLGATDMVVIDGDPMLGALADNGGPTPTMLPLPGSPLLDAIPSGACPYPTDQRGFARPQGGACDIGAVEGPAPP